MDELRNQIKKIEQFKRLTDAKCEAAKVQYCHAQKQFDEAKCSLDKEQESYQNTLANIEEYLKSNRICPVRLSSINLLVVKKNEDICIAEKRLETAKLQLLEVTDAYKSVKQEHEYLAKKGSILRLRFGKKMSDSQDEQMLELYGLNLRGK